VRQYQDMSLEDMDNIRALDFFQKPWKREWSAERIKCPGFEKEKSFAKARYCNQRAGGDLLMYPRQGKNENWEHRLSCGVAYRLCWTGASKIALQEVENRTWGRSLKWAVTDCMIMMTGDFTIKWATTHAERYFGSSLTGRKCYDNPGTDWIHPAFPCIGQAVHPRKGEPRNANAM